VPHEETGHVELGVARENKLQHDEEGSQAEFEHGDVAGALQLREVALDDQAHGGRALIFHVWGYNRLFELQP
jgi:hypothetical protein